MMLTKKPNTKVVLVNPPIETRRRHWFPLGIGYIASFIRRHGYEVEVIDCIGDYITRSEFKQIIRRIGAKCFGIGGIVTAFNNVSDIASYIREAVPDAFIFAGNTVAYSIPEIILQKTEVDVVVCGEGELTTLDLIRTYMDGNDINSVRGIIYLNETGELCQNSAREAIQDIDSLPFPAWDLLPLEKYFKNVGYRYCLISSVRGCPYKCIYCCRTFMDYRIRYRSAKSAISELLEFHNKYKISKFFFFDDLSTVNKERMLEFCRLKMKSPLAPMTWTISARVNLIDDDILKALKKSKCVDIGFGFESMDQGILDEIGKKIKTEQIEEAILMCDKYKMNYKGSSFMIGAPSETEATVKKSSDFCKKHNLRYEPHFITPFPGTKLYEDCIKNRLIHNEFEYIKRIAIQGHTNSLLVNVTNNLSDSELNALYRKYIYFPKSSIWTYLARFLLKPWKYIYRILKNKKKVMNKILRIVKPGDDFTYSHAFENSNDWE